MMEKKRLMTIRPATIIPHVEKRNLIIALIILFILLGGMFYYFVYPRTDIEIQVWYAEGFLGTTTVDVTIRNRAASLIAGADVSLSLINSTGDDVSFMYYPANDIGPWGTIALPSMSISGRDMGDNTHFDDYEIRLSFSFAINGEKHSHTFSYFTEEPYMNLFFSESIGGFLF